MKKVFSTGEKIWIVSIILYLIWVLIGIKLHISLFNISIFGSIGMIVFVIISMIICIIKNTIT